MVESTLRLGRPTKFTAEVRKKVLWALRLGNYRKTAAEYAGISERTLCVWVARGEQGEAGEYREFLDQVLEAEQTAEVRALGVIHQAATKDWKAAAWFLERKFPERYCVRAAVYLEKRLPTDADFEGMNEDELTNETLKAIAQLASTIPRDKLLAAIDGKEPETRVIEASSGNGQAR